MRGLNTFKQWVKLDDMARHSFIMVSFLLLALVFNYLYQLIMGILLPVDQYGTLLTLISILTILILVPQAFQISVAKITSKFKAENKLGRVNYLWRFSLKRTFLLGLASVIVLILIAPLISRFLNIDNIWYAIVLFPSLLFGFILSINWGVLQGLQGFLPLGSSSALLTFLRLAIGVLLVYIGFGVLGGLSSFLISYVAVFLITLLFLRGLPAMGNEAFEVRGLFSYTALAFVAIMSFTVLSNIDIILVKRYLSPDYAGNYAAMSVLGRVALYAPMGVGVVMFPKTSELFETSQETRPVLRMAGLLTLLIAGVVVIIYLFFSAPLVGFLFGDKYPLIAPYLFKYGLAMLLLALSSLLMNYFLSLNQMKVAYSLLGVMLLEIGLIILFHSSIAQVVDVMLICSAVSLISMLPFYVKTRRRNPVREQK